MQSTYQEATNGYELLLKFNLLKIHYLLQKNNLITTKSTSSLPNQAEEKLKFILQYIESHYTEALTIQCLADLCHFSKCHFMNFFKKYVGVTCMEYIIDYRLNMIASKLTNQSCNITELALDAGFNNISYFNRAFKKKYGVTPKKYGLNLDRHTFSHNLQMP
jgi:AraC-like DNA-binding protein